MVRIAVLTLVSLTWMVGGLTGNLLAQDNNATNPLQALYVKGVGELNSGDYKNAVIDFQSLAGQVSDPDAQEQVYYYLGVAYYNEPDYTQCLSVFQGYLSKFHTGKHIPEVNLDIARCYNQQKKYDDALALLKTLEGYPTIQLDVLGLECSIYKATNKLGDAIATLEKIVLPEVKSQQAANAALVLIPMYNDNGQADKAIDLLHDVNKKFTLLGDPMQLNQVAIQLGDVFLKGSDYAKALDCYRCVRTKEQIAQYLNEKIDVLQNQVKDDQSAIQANPALNQNFGQEIADDTNEIAANKDRLTKLDAVPSFASGVWLRMGEAFYRLGQKWESVVVLDRILTDYPDSPERELALFQKIQSLSDLRQSASGLKACDEFIKSFPKSANLPTVLYLQGALSFQSGDFQSAEAFFTKAIPQMTDPKLQDEMLFTLATCEFANAQYQQAIDSYSQYQKKFATGKHVEEVAYRLAMAYLLNGSGNFDKAGPLFQDYMTKYPSGSFIADATFRYLSCLYNASKYPDVITGCQNWIKTYATSPELAEVWGLLGDAYEGAGQDDPALDAYKNSYKNSKDTRVYTPAITSADQILEKKPDWDGTAELWKQFITDHPDDPSYVLAVQNIANALVHSGKSDEAKGYLVEAIKKSAGDPAQDVVDNLILTLIKICCVKPDPASGGTPPPDPATALDTILQPLSQMSSPTAKARALYAKAKLAEVQKKPDDENRYLKQIADTFDSKDLSAALLGQVADYLAAQKNWDKATTLYKTIVTQYPNCSQIDFALVGLGNVALGKKDYNGALTDFQQALDKVPDGQKVKEATLGKGQSLLGLNKLDDAQKIFEEVASTREWKGEATAWALFYMGEIQMKSSPPDYAKAIAYYQRVYVAYKRYAPVVAKAYMRSGDAFLALKDNTSAWNTYTEMLNDKDLVNLPEADEARKHLQELPKPQPAQ